MKNNNNLLIFISLFSVFTFLLMTSGCFKKGAKRDAHVEDCSIYNDKEQSCIAALQYDLRRCKFDKITLKCMPDNIIQRKACDKMDKDECQESKFCTFLDNTHKCEDAEPALSGKCELIQAENPCINDKTCQWNKASLVCEDKK